MFTEGCLVIAKVRSFFYQIISPPVFMLPITAQGEYKDDVFVVSQLALPPYESQETTEATFPGKSTVNPYGYRFVLTVGVDFFGKRPPLRILKEVQQQVRQIALVVAVMVT